MGNDFKSLKTNCLQGIHPLESKRQWAYFFVNQVMLWEHQNFNINDFTTIAMLFYNYIVYQV